MRDRAYAPKTNIFKMNSSDQAKLFSSNQWHPDAKGCLGVQRSSHGCHIHVIKKTISRTWPTLKTQTDILPQSHLSHPCSKTRIRREDSDIQDAWNSTRNALGAGLSVIVAMCLSYWVQRSKQPPTGHQSVLFLWVVVVVRIIPSPLSPRSHVLALPPFKMVCPSCQEALRGKCCHPDL